MKSKLFYSFKKSSGLSPKRKKFMPKDYRKQAFKDVVAIVSGLHVMVQRRGNCDGRSHTG